MVLVTGGTTLGVSPGRTTLGQTGATLDTPLADLDLADFAFVDGTDGDRLRDGGKVDDDIFTDADDTDTNTDTYTYTLRETN